MIAWIVVVSALALVLLVTFLSAVLNAAILVDRVPGGDAGLATTPALDSAYQTMNWTFPALIVVVAIGIAAPIIAKLSRPTRAVPQRDT